MCVYIYIKILSQLSGIHRQILCSGLHCYWTGVGACWWFIAEQKAGRSSSLVLGLRGT